MAARNLRDGRRRSPRATRKRAAELGVDEEEIASWRDAADAIVIPYDEELGVTPQSEDFTRYRHWDFAGTPAEQLPAAAALSRTTCCTPARSSSRPTSSSRCTPAATASATSRRRATSSTTSAITVRDSSLSACVQAIVAAEVGHVELAYDYLGETRVHRPARPRVQHEATASTSRRWRAAGSSRSPASAGCATTATRCPSRRACRPALTRLSFRLLYRGRRLRVTVARREARYELLDGEPLELCHHGEPLTVTFGEVQKRALPPPPQRIAPDQPPGRSPPLGVVPDPD